MNNKHFARIIIIFASILLFFGCTDNPIPYDLSDSDLNIDTLTINSINGITYSSPPLMGGTDNLYFGDENGYKSLFTLLQYSFISIDQTIWTHSLVDSDITVDSVVFSFKSDDSTLSTNSQFELFYFPVGGDTVFSETSSNYLNFGTAELNDTLSLGKAVFSQRDPDSTETVYPELRFRIKDVDEVIEFLADTSVNKNRSFLLRNIEPIDNIIKIKSRESFDYPLISVFYRTEDDTLQVDFFSIADVSIVEPRLITDIDRNSISVGRGSGLKSIMTFDFGDFPIDSSVFVINSANLILKPLDQIEDDSFEINSVILADSIDLKAYSNYTEDTFEINSEIMTGNFENNQFKIDIRSFIQGINTGSYKNYGLKIYSSSANDPFQSINFISDNNSTNNSPYLQIIYVKL